MGHKLTDSPFEVGPGPGAVSTAVAARMGHFAAPFVSTTASAVAPVVTARPAAVTFCIEIARPRHLQQHKCLR